MIVVKIVGNLNKRDLARIVSVMREIDEEHPNELISLNITDADGDSERGEFLLREMLPPLPTRATEFARAAYRDDSYPERVCYHCGGSYRGPAVYCSIECAVADA